MATSGGGGRRRVVEIIYLFGLSIRIAKSPLLDIRSTLLLMPLLQCSTSRAQTAFCYGRITVRSDEDAENSSDAAEHTSKANDLLA